MQGITYILKQLTFVLYLLPWGLCAFYSFWEAGSTLWKAQGVSLPSYKTYKGDSINGKSLIDFKRMIQKEFRDNGMFLPLEDIVTHAELSEVKLKENIKRICGVKAAYYVFLPLMIKLPFLGKKNLEMCLKPRIK